MEKELGGLLYWFKIDEVPTWANDMFNHPILFMLAFVTVGLWVVNFKRKLKDGEIQLTEKEGKLLAYVGILASVVIATL